MACDRCGARIEGGAYPSDDEGSQDLCFDCAVADGAKNVAEAIQCAHGRRYGEPCPLRARVKELEEQQKDLIEASEQKNTPCGDAIDLLWKEIILAKDPKYGDWEYPGQAYRHLKAEYEELQARVKELEAKPTHNRDGLLSAMRRFRSTQADHG